MGIVSISEALAYLRIEDDDSAALLQLADDVDSIGFAIENHLNEIVTLRQFTERLSLRGGPFVLSNLPVVELLTVQTVDAVTVLDVADFDVTPSGVVHTVPGGSGPAWGRYEITYTAGYATVPSNYKRGALVVLEHLWEARRGTSDLIPGVVGDEETFNGGLDSLVVRKAEEWLGPRKPAIA